MQLSVIIPSYNGLIYLKNCVPSLMKAVEFAGIETEMIVVDDCSNDGTAAWLAMNHPDIKVVTQDEQSGFAKAVNAGFRVAQGDWIALLNNDVVVAKEWIKAALGVERPPGVGAIASCILYEHEKETINRNQKHQTKLQTRS